MRAQVTQPAAPPQAKRENFARAMQMWEILLFVSVTVVVALMGVAGLRMWKRRQARYAPPPRQPTRFTDVWEESARRVPLESAEGVVREVVPTGDPVVPGPGVNEDPNADTKTGLVLPSGTDRPVVLVTGGARRVGRAIAEAFADAGFDVLITFRTSDREADETVAALRKRGVSAGSFRVDLGELDTLDKWACQLVEHLPRLDVLVHNAAIYEPSSFDESVVLEAMRHSRVNALAPLLLSARLAPLLAASSMEGGGSIVCMTDIHAMGRPRRGFTAYSMSKAALTEMIHSLARELAPTIRVNGVAPGVVAWPEEGVDADPAEQRGYVRRIPLGRAGTPEDAAKAVRWLATEATYVTGEIIRVDGGRWLT